MATKLNRTIIVIVVIAFFAIMLQACAPVKLAANAANIGSAPATGINVNLSSRLDKCNMSSRQLILNDANAQGSNVTITVDTFLDNEMSKQACIAAK